jgi:ABC-type cobalt transport system substrate-binding protein
MTKSTLKSVLKLSVHYYMLRQYQTLFGGEERPARKADNITANYEPIVYKIWDP